MRVARHGLLGLGRQRDGAPHGFRERRRVAGGERESVNAVLDQFARASALRDNGRAARRQRFHRSEVEYVPQRGNQIKGSVRL